VPALDGTEWRLEDLAGSGVLDDAEATLAFTEPGKAVGRGSCNRFFANVEISGDSIRFGPIAATRMACGKATMRQEGRYFKALEAAERFSLDNATLLLYSRGLDRPLRFVKQDS
jgi:heat shock protein HslJ